MPAPKQYKPGPRMSGPLERLQRSQAAVAKSKYAATPHADPLEDEDVAVEVAVDDITVVMPASKYDRRSFHAYSDDPVSVEPDELDEPEPAPVELHHLGEWRSESRLEGSHYYRKDTRLS